MQITQIHVLPIVPVVAEQFQCHSRRRKLVFGILGHIILAKNYWLSFCGPLN